MPVDGPTTTDAQSIKTSLVDRLDARIKNHLTEVIEQTDLYRLVSSPQTSARLTAGLIRHLMVESFAFTPRIVTTTFKAIGKMPFDMPEAMKQACLHVLEEVDHPEMALRTFKSLGGDEQWARKRRMTPASFAMCAACDALIVEETGLAYLGFMYPFESLTPILTERAMQWLQSKGIGSEKREFIDTHAVDDIAHQRAMRNLIAKISARHPEAEESIEYGCDIFFSVYPEPIWQAVVNRARAEVGE